MNMSESFGERVDEPLRPFRKIAGFDIEYLESIGRECNYENVGVGRLKC